MGKGKSIYVDEKTYRRLQEISSELNMKSIGELLKILAGTHPILRLFVDNPENFYRKVIESIRYSLGVANVNYMKSIEKVSQQRSKTSSYQPDRATSHNTNNKEELIKRAKQYRDKIIKEQGFITSEQLERVAKKFRVPVKDLIDDLVMKENDKYYPY